MAKLVKNKEATGKKSKITKVRDSKNTENSYDEEFDKNEQESVTDEDQSIKSKFLDECEIAFCEKDLYKILCLDKSKATQTDS
jgi:hypothetical protein